MTFEIESAPGWLVVQDLGRPGHAAAGVPEGGAADPWALVAANLAVGNPPDAAGLEWAAGGGRLCFRAPSRLALAGAQAGAWLGGRPIVPGEALEIADGDRLEVGRFGRGRYLYLALAGGLDTVAVLGSRSTYLPSRIGGYEGRRLARGDRLSTIAGPPPARPDAELAQASRAALQSASRALESTAIRVVPGPEAPPSEDARWRTLLESEWRVSPRSDRGGIRLLGPAIAGSGDPGFLSKPLVPGAIELTAEGPIVVGADGPTTGGYPVLAVVVRCDLARLWQRSPGEVVRLERVDIEAARRSTSEDLRLLDRLRRIAGEPDGAS
ncbi:MAG: allophanate hydrolase [Thermoanaerobaculia bacterium]